MSETVSVKSDSKSKLIILTSIVLAIFGLGFSYFLVDGLGFQPPGNRTNPTVNSAPVSSSQTAANSIPPLPPKPDSIQLNTLFFGDVFWGRSVNDWSQASDLKAAYPFSGLSTFERDKYDAWIANLECPVTTTKLSTAEQERLLKFSCPPEYTSEAAKWFNAFSLANNHTDNMQEVDGFQQTRQFLEASQIQYFGHYDNAAKQDVCEIVGLPSKAFKAGQLMESNPPTQPTTVPIALCGFHGVFELPLKEEMAVIQTYSALLPTFVIPHQGVEYQLKPNRYQQSTYRQMIDFGADAVIGAHPHVVQTSEAYQQKLIVYSLGNFIFDQQGKDTTEGAGLNVKLDFILDDNMQQWLELGDSCRKFKDNCLEQARQKGLRKPLYQIKYDIVPTTSANKLTRLGTPELLQKLLTRLTWSQTLEKLKSNS